MRNEIGELTLAQVRVLVRRARVMRDKHAALLKRQTTVARTSTGAGRGALDANRRTQQKLALFEEALRRFEVRGSQLEDGAARTAAPTGRGGTPSAKATARRAPTAPARSSKAPGTAAP